MSNKQHDLSVVRRVYHLLRRKAETICALQKKVESLEQQNAILAAEKDGMELERDIAQKGCCRKCGLPMGVR
jgi:hypothetical protein